MSQEYQQEQYDTYQINSNNLIFKWKPEEKESLIKKSNENKKIVEYIYDIDSQFMQTSIIKPVE